jgi:hypothetical protein
MSLITNAIYNIPGAFDLKKTDSIPTPLGIEIDENGGIVYLGASLDKRSMRGDRTNVFKDISNALYRVKREQTSKTNQD